MISPPMEAVLRKMRRALDPVRATEGVPSMSEAYRQNRIRLGIRPMFDNITCMTLADCPAMIK